MAIDGPAIRRLIENYRLWSELDPDKDVLISADRGDLRDSARLERVFEELEPKLLKAGFDDTAIWSVKDIMLELASNTILHGKGGRENSELLVVSRRGRQLSVWLFGYASPHQLKRLDQIIGQISTLAQPPDHREKLLELRNQDLLRRLSSPPSSRFGSGMGMLTIAALSSHALKFVTNQRGDPSSFLLQSSIQSARS